MSGLRGLSARLLELTAAHFERAPDADKLAAADALYSVARLSGRAAAALCERAARVFIELKPNDATTWNLGICAPGAGQGKLALDLWRQKLWSSATTACQRVSGPTSK